MQTLRREAFNLPNLLTYSRIFFAFIIIILLWMVEYNISSLRRNLVLSLSAFWLFVAASITDSIDGYLARKYKSTTDFGKLLDPIADKVLVISVLIMLIPLKRIDAWMSVVFILREVIITGVRSIAASEGEIIQASSMGKLKTVLQSIALGALIFYHPIRIFDFVLDTRLIGNVTIWLALVVSVWSAADYLSKYFGYRLKK